MPLSEEFVVPILKVLLSGESACAGTTSVCIEVGRIYLEMIRNILIFLRPCIMNSLTISSGFDEEGEEDNLGLVLNDAGGAGAL